jgi:hypothetical protein
MKGYIRLKDPDEEIFLAEGAGCVPAEGGAALQYRAWDATGFAMCIPAERLVTIRLGTGQRPEGYAPVPREGNDTHE